MGELADQITNGESCELCITPFIDQDHPDNLYAHGYPVVCWDCWKTLSKSEKLVHQRAAMPTINDLFTE